MRDYGRGGSPRLVLGIFLMALGVLFTLGNLRLIDARQYLRYWPVVLIAIGLSKLTSSGHRGKLGGSIWLLIGCWLLASNLGLVSVSFWSLWPGIVFLFLGAALAFGALRPRGPEPDGVPSADTLRLIAFMGGTERSSASQSFRGGELTAIMGGCELDLTRAQPVEGGAVIETLAFMGGIDIKVPEDWAVECRGVPFMGGYEDSTRPPALDTGKRLVINGFAMMGGVEVHN
jgi:predicted membrane protein